jgi:fructokinase
MQRVLASGESLLDLIISPEGTTVARPGGSTLNACISLGRLGFPVWFISAMGADHAGDLIFHFLQENKVHTDFIYRYKDGQTALALAFLDEKKEARYSFYKNYPSRLYEGRKPGFTRHDLFLFGSFYAISPETRPVIVNLLHDAREAGSLIFYDPNYRTAHDHEKQKLIPLIMENLRSADIIRGSEEDFYQLFGARSAQESYQSLPGKEKILLYTTAKQGVTLITNKLVRTYPTSSIQPVSTIGAGDNFNAGLVYCIARSIDQKENVRKAGPAFWDKAVPFAICCATRVCLSFDNYLDRKEAEDLAKEVLG